MPEAAVALSGPDPPDQACKQAAGRFESNDAKSASVACIELRWWGAGADEPYPVFSLSWPQNISCTILAVHGFTQVVTHGM